MLIYRSLLDLLFPPRCVGCHREGAYFCPDCRRQLEPIEPPYCLVCGRPGASGRGCASCRPHLRSIDGIRAGFLYQGPARAAVLALKYRGLRVVAPELGRLLAERWRQSPIAVDAVAPVPLHPARSRSRGYNQAELIGRAFSKTTGLPLRTDLLRRVRDTASQVDVGSPAARRANVAGAFGSAGAVQGLRVLLLDDVCTTGATLDEAASALKRAGAAGVWGWVFARDV